jgi:crossover junction endodeoxyribonuclease RuvC
MRVLGIDPALTKTGFGVIDLARADRPQVVCAGTIRTDPRQPTAKRLLVLFTETQALIRRFRPQVMVLEKVFVHYRHPATAAVLGHARGALCCAAAACGLPVEECAARRVKKALVGRGGSSKLQVQRMVTTLAGQRDCARTTDATDALALAIAFGARAAVVRRSQRR